MMVLLGLFGSFLSGLFGIGGAIINYPLLLFVPSALGVAQFTTQEVSAISMFQVFFSSLAGVMAAFLARRKNPGGPEIDRGLVLYMGVSILLGSLAGGMVSGYLEGGVINVIYGVLAIIAVVLMLIPSKGEATAAGGSLTFNKPIAVILAFLVGIVSGIVGAGGAFLLIPIMLTILNIPIRTTIVSSLAIVFLSAVGGVIGKIMAGGIPLIPTLYTVIGSLIGAPIGSRVGSKLNTGVLRYGLVLVIGITAIKVWSTVF